MAHYKQIPPHIVGEDKTRLVETIHQKVFLGAEEGTEVLIVSPSGFVDPITQEVTYAAAPTWFNVSGIVGSIEYGDMLLGHEARIVADGGSINVGTLKVSYEWDTIQSVAYNDIQNVRLASPGVRGLYHVVARTVDTFGGVPLFFDLALAPDRNGPGIPGSPSLPPGLLSNPSDNDFSPMSVK